MKLRSRLMTLLDRMGCVQVSREVTTVNGVTYINRQRIYWQGLLLWAVLVFGALSEVILAVCLMGDS